MRRLFVAATLCAAVFALAVGTASAALPHASVAGKSRPDHGRAAAGDGAHLKAHFVPLGARLAGSTTVSGYVFNSSHSALSNIAMEWDALVSGNWTWGTGVTDGFGHYSVAANSTTNGEIYAYPDKTSAFARGQRTWTAGGSDAIDLYPGRVNVEAYRGGRWQTGSTDGVSLRLFGETEYSRGFVSAASATSDAIGAVDVLDGTYDQGGSVRWFWDEGVEVPGPITVTSGTTLVSPITAYESEAQRVWMAKPYWGSGKPGATVTIARNNFPAGWRSFVYGYTDDPKQTSYREYGTKVSQSTATANLSVKIPSTAKPGYRYFIGFQHVDAAGDPLPLYIEEGYQVCTMKPTKASITKGTRIKIKGIVPTQLSHRKYAWVLWHKGTAAVPTNWNATKQGWVPLVRVRTTGTGAYASPYLTRSQTGTFVVQYDGDQTYWGAYTSTAKVTVR